MKASELRIGNLILHGTSIHEIAALLPNNEYYDSLSAITHTERDLNDCVGIPLTEEWLIKFGFNKRSMHGYDRHFEYHHHKLRSPITALHNADFSMQLDQCARGVNHVHRLQNLFFDITGEELTI